MKRHPSQSVLRQILDEPGAVPELDRTHAASCPSCRRNSEAMAADAAVAAAALMGANQAADPLPALRRLRSAETGVVPPKPTLADRFRTRVQLAGRRTLRAGAILTVVVASMGALVATGVASNVIQIFQPENFVAVPIDITSLGTLPDLTGYGSVRVLQPPRATAASSLADAASSSGLHLLTPGKLPARAAGVLALRYSGLSYAEVAEAMGIGVGQVGTVLRRAEARLKREVTL